MGTMVRWDLDSRPKNKISLKGDLINSCISHMDELGRRLVSLIDNDLLAESNEIVLDCSGLTHIDGHGLQCLFSASARLKGMRPSRHLKIVNVPAFAKERFQHKSLDIILDVSFKDEVDAAPR